MYPQILRKSLILVAAVVAVPALAEDWPGYEGGNLHHNASTVDIDPAGLEVLWQKRFDKPVDCRTTNPGFYGSRNLALVDGKLAVVACIEPVDVAKVATDCSYAYVTVLDARTGKVLNCIATTQATGPRRHQMQYPLRNHMEAYDTGIGITVMHWDPTSGILFLRNGGDNPSNTAYLPLANAASFAGRPQKGVGAYEDFIRRRPDWTDADGHTRQQKEIPQDAKRWLDGDQWDYGNANPKSFNNQPNSTAFFEVDPGSDTMAAAIAPSHTQSRGYFICNKTTGQYGKPYSGVVSNGATPGEDRTVFAKWGGIRVGNGRIYFMGPCDDTGGDGFQTSLFKMDKPDQGLRIICSKVAWGRKRNAPPASLPDGDEAAFAALADTAEVTPEWEYTFHSPHQPETPEDAESYLELDAFHRNKAWLLDGGTVWAAWKPTRAGCVQLIRCDAAGSRTFELPVGKGQRGQDLWPHISLATVGEKRNIPPGTYIAYYAGNALYRKFVGSQWSPAEETPLGPAALAVFDVSAGKAWSVVLNAPDGSGPHATLPPNEAEGYFDRSHMVVAGRRAFIAWTDVTAHEPGNVILHLLAYDLAAGPEQKPTGKTIDLEIPKAGNARTCVFDLIAADGVLYALITESDTLTSGSHTWTAQRVVAIGTGRDR